APGVLPVHGHQERRGHVRVRGLWRHAVHLCGGRDPGPRRRARSGGRHVRGGWAMSGEKTERPTDHRLRKAREDGQVAKSKDFTQTLLTGALFGYTLAASGEIVRMFVEIMAAPSTVYGMEFRGALAIMV